MCDPVLMGSAMIGISAVQQGAQMYQQGQVAEAQEKAIEFSRRADQQATKLQQQEITQQAQENLGVRAREAIAQRARMRVAAGEAGLAGAGRLEAVSRVNQGLDAGAITETASRQLAQSTANMQRLDAQRASLRSRIQQPSLLVSGLKIASTAASVAGQGYFDG